jgi:predicted enzyme related to lactoylglutathione lyase
MESDHMKLRLPLAVAFFCAILPPARAQEVVGTGNFGHIVENLDRSIAFYRDAIGLEPPATVRPFDPNPAIMKMGNTLGAQSRVAVLRLPGFTMGLELIEYKDIERKPLHPHFQDPGTGNLNVRVRDLDAVVTRLKTSGGHILTPGAAPAEIGGTRALFVQDPDGFVIELSQPKTPPASPAGNVIGGGVEVTVQDAEKAAQFYETVFGFSKSMDASFNGNPLMTATAGVPGSEFRHSRVKIPGANLSLNFIEFSKIDRHVLSSRVQDPGTSLVQLRVRGLDALLKKVKSAGGTVVSVGEEPVQVGTFGRIAIARDPNNLFLELIEAN